MQNGSDTLKDQSESIANQSSRTVEITEAEISLENIKHSRQSSVGTELSASAKREDITEPVEAANLNTCLSQKGQKNDVSVDPSLAAQPVTSQNTPEKPREGEITEVGVYDGIEMEMAVSEDESMDEDHIDNIGADDAVVEPYMQSLVKPEDGLAQMIKKKRGRPSRKLKPEEEQTKPTLEEPGSTETEPIPKPNEEEPKKALVEEKVKKKVGRPRKVPVEETVKPTVQPSGETGEPGPDVDLFTYVPGRTSEPIQLSTVSSVVSGSDLGSAASLEGEPSLERIPEEGKPEASSTVELKKLLKSKILKKTGRPRKRKSMNVKERPGKIRKVTTNPPAEDSSSLQKKQDLINFLDDAKKVLSEQEQDTIALDGDLEEARAAALMSKGPCLDLDEEDIPLKQTVNYHKTLKQKKVKRPYRRKIPKTPKIVNSSPEIATVSNQFESLNTKDVEESVHNGDAISQPLVPSQKLKVKPGRPRKYRKKNNLPVLKARWNKKPVPVETVAIVHEAPQASSQETPVTEPLPEQPPTAPAINTGANISNGTQEISEKPLLPEKRLKKTTKGTRYRKKKMHNWNKRKQHSPAVLLRLARQMEAIRVANELAIAEGYYEDVNPESVVQQSNTGVLPAEPNTVLPEAQQAPAEGLPLPKPKRKYTRKKPPVLYTNIYDGWESVSNESFVAGPKLKYQKKKKSPSKLSKKTSPVVEISPIGNKSTQDATPSQSSSVQPSKTRVSNMETNHTISSSNHQEHDNTFTDYHSDMSSSSKRSYLKPKIADEFEKDTGAVSLKNILPGRRSSAPSRNLNPYLGITNYGGYSIVKRGQGRKNYMGRGYTKKYNRGMISQNVNKTEANTDTLNQSSSSLYQDMSMSDFDTSIQDKGYHDKISQPTPAHKPRSSAESRKSREYYVPEETSYTSPSYTPPNHQHERQHEHRPRERQHHRGSSSHYQRHSPAGHKHSFSEDNDAPSSAERNSSRSHTDSPGRKGVIGNTVGAVISQLFGDEIPRLSPGSGYVINVRLDVERKESTGSRHNNKNMSAQEDLDRERERRRHSSHHSTSREKSTHVSSTVNSYSRKSQPSEPQPSTSATPDDLPPREDPSQRPQISDVDLCAMLEERISSRLGLRIDVRDNLLDNIKHVERVLKESS